MKPLSISEMHLLAKSKNGKCLSKQYINSYTKLIWECSEKHQWEATSNLIKSGSWCKQCHLNKTYGIKTKKDLNNIAKKFGGKALSDYKSSKTKIKWECKNGHTWFALLHNVKRNSWCPYCASSFSEEICRTYFETIFKEKFIKSRPKWLNGLELDGFNPKLKLAFEHQGLQHFKDKHFGNTKEDLIKIQKNDKLKVEICKRNNITLIVIPQLGTLTSTEQLVNLISKYYPNLNIDLQNIKFKTKCEKQLNKIKTISKKKGGKCLSKIYINNSTKMEFQCSNNHKWKATPDSIIHRNSWCPHCVGCARHSISEIDLIAKKYNGKCLSSSYKNNKSKLLWECDHGHTFSRSLSKIKVGRWCSICRKTRKPTVL